MSKAKNIKKVVTRGIDPYAYLVATRFLKASAMIKHLGLEPHIVNLSFSIELFLKSMQVKSETTFDPSSNHPSGSTRIQSIRGHLLYEEVFLKLDDSLQSELSILYNNKFNRVLDDDLSEIQTGFVDFRYSFEKPSLSISLTSLENIAEFLKEYIEKRMEQGRYSS
jgi:hypothetical protein